MMQAIDAHLPGIYENGAGLYFPSPYRFAVHPAIGAKQRDLIARARQAIGRALIEPGIAQFQPGKEVSITLYPARPGVTFEEIAEIARKALDGVEGELVVMPLVTSVDIVLRGMDKGAGVEWLSREVGIPLEQMGGIGDSAGDLSFLGRVGFSAAPANATEDVQQAVQYASPFQNGKAVVDILTRWL
jgi:hypothetical protein